MARSIYKIQIQFDYSEIESDGCFYLNMQMEFRLHISKKLSKLFMVVISYISIYRTNPINDQLIYYCFKIKAQEKNK